ncbi:YlmH/Sll1252 family protein [Shimazuella sp. AN120528]|uniref:YlmH family RNA-binding protein n=1 Tax=Shimazuella soli TaxID=1892854 RepID=UPI001F0EEEEA|nr:YlmH/Sll1252 family protein [Shimazuella soli]MCH5584728.1 YlmH/Sll1252 family protein [Shimazuella soli]
MEDHQLFTHFRKEEHAFVERGLDWIYQVSRKHQVVLTPFLDPREQYILTTLVNRENQDIRMEKDGGYINAERCRVCIYPEYLFPNEDDFSLVYLSLDSEFSLEHREVLGSLLGLGIQRYMLGDILPKSNGADVIIAKEMKDYVIGTLTKVGRKGIIISEIARDQLWTEQQQEMEQQTVVSSLRLDTIIAAVCRISRSKSVDLVRLGKCKVNWQTIDQAGYIVTTGDVISVRGYGRIRLNEVREPTKKGRFPIRYLRNL